MSTEAEQRPRGGGGVGAPTRAAAHHWPRPAGPSPHSGISSAWHGTDQEFTRRLPLLTLPFSCSLLPHIAPSLPPHTDPPPAPSLLYSGPRAFKRPRAVRATSSSRGESGRVLPPDGQSQEPLRRAAHAGGRGHRGGPPVRLHHTHRRWVTEKLLFPNKFTLVTLGGANMSDVCDDLGVAGLFCPLATTNLLMQL